MKRKNELKIKAFSYMLDILDYQLFSLMSNTNRYTTNNTRSGRINRHLPHFLFVMTNYQNLLQRTERYQRPNPVNQEKVNNVYR
jgi:hypothetical protein